MRDVLFSFMFPSRVRTPSTFVSSLYLFGTPSNADLTSMPGDSGTAYQLSWGRDNFIISFTLQSGVCWSCREPVDLVVPAMSSSESLNVRSRAHMMVKNRHRTEENRKRKSNGVRVSITSRVANASARLFMYFCCQLSLSASSLKLASFNVP